jgi:hypothetical protein
LSTGKAGLFPKTYVERVTPRTHILSCSPIPFSNLSLEKAKAAYSYTGDNPDELPFSEGDILSIVDTSEAEWWKAEQGGVVFIVPAAYLELVEG